jgi:hypothetical protein
MIYTLNLPKPSNELITLIKSIADVRETNWGSKSAHEAILGNHVNCAAGDFFEHPSVTTLALLEYDRFFPGKKITPMIGLIRNTKTESTSSYGPHSDRVRTVGINFYIDLGGENVSTVFYDKFDPLDDLVGGHNATYNELTAVEEVFFKNDIWYAFNTKQYHSVENIETTRIMLTLSMVNIPIKNLVAFLEK